MLRRSWIIIPRFLRPRRIPSANILPGNTTPDSRFPTIPPQGHPWFLIGTASMATVLGLPTMDQRWSQRDVTDPISPRCSELNKLSYLGMGSWKAQVVLMARRMGLAALLFSCLFVFLAARGL